MSTSRHRARQVRENLGYIGAALTLLVAAIHLFHPQHGFPRLVLLLGTGNLSLFVTDPRPVAFVLSGFALLAGIQLVVAEIGRKQVYLIGIALVATYFVGYFAWHLSGHGGFLPGREPLYHGMHPVQAVVTHLGTSPVAALSKLAEGLLFLVLATLYRRESATETA